MQAGLVQTWTEDSVSNPSSLLLMSKAKKQNRRGTFLFYRILCRFFVQLRVAVKFDRSVTSFAFVVAMSVFANVTSANFLA